MTTITMTTKELSVSRSGNSEESCGSRKLSRRHFCFYKINDASQSEKTWISGERASIHWSHLTNTGEITLDYCKKYRFRYQCVCNYMCCVRFFNGVIICNIHMLFSFQICWQKNGLNNVFSSKNLVSTYF